MPKSGTVIVKEEETVSTIHTRSRIAHRLFGCVIALGMTAFPFVSAQAAEWRMHSQWSEKRPEAGWLNEFAEKVKARTNGDVDITVYHGGSLNLKDADLLRTMPSGGVEAAMTIAENFSRDAPEIANIYVTGMIKDPEDHFAVAPVLKEIYSDYFAKNDIVMVGSMQPTLFPLQILCSDDAVNNLASLKGKKLRVFSKDLLQTFRYFDVAAQILPQSEIYLGMQKGVLDCAVYGYNSAKSVSLHEVAKYGSYFATYAAAPYPILVNKDAWEALSDDNRKAVMAVADEMYEKTAEMATDYSLEESAKEEMVGKGFKVLDSFPTDDQQQIQKQSFIVARELAAEGGKAAEENLNKVLDALGL